MTSKQQQQQQTTLKINIDSLTMADNSVLLPILLALIVLQTIIACINCNQTTTIGRQQQQILARDGTSSHHTTQWNGGTKSKLNQHDPSVHIQQPTRTINVSSLIAAGTITNKTVLNAKKTISGDVSKKKKELTTTKSHLRLEEKINRAPKPAKIIQTSSSAGSHSSHSGPPVWINLGLGKDALMVSQQNDETLKRLAKSKSIHGKKHDDNVVGSLPTSQLARTNTRQVTTARQHELVSQFKRETKKLIINHNDNSSSSSANTFHVTETGTNSVLLDHKDHLLVDPQSTGLGNNNDEWSARDTYMQEQLRKIPCDKLTGLTTGQAQLCQLYKDHMPYVGLGAKMTIDECQYQFRKNRWNCSIQDSQSVFGPIIKTGVRETAFLNALSSASIVYTIARACRDGQLANCGCSTADRPKSVKANWNWAGCGDNINYAYKFSEEFVDLKERELLPPEKYKSNDEADPKIAKAKLDRKRLMNIHNNQAGRRAVVRKTKITCKCHGVSGSCALVTCWQQLPNFRDIGDFLKERYDIATEVKFSKHEGKIQVRNKRQNIQQRPTVDDLIYIEQSPDFCTKVDKFAYAGTSGRACNSTLSNTLANGRANPHQPDDSCQKMCCSRGFKMVRILNSYKCNCKFKYCCKMECQTCYKAHMQSVCN